MPELDNLRGVAILMVVCLHGLYWSPGLGVLDGPVGVLSKLSRFGGRGVNLFFVLSGFLITGILLDSRNKPDYFRGFYARRARRILPIFYVTLLLLLLTPGQSKMYLAISCFFVSNFAPLFGVSMTYTMLWTLAVEEQFYLLWPLAVRRLSNRTLLAVAIGIAIITAVLRGIFWNPAIPEGFGYYTWFVADGLALGAVLALLVRLPGFDRTSLKKVAATTIAVWAVSLVAGAPFGILYVSNRFGAALSLTLTNFGFAALLATALWVGSGPYHRWIRWRILEFFGYISYGLYLIHWLVFDRFDAVVNKFRPGTFPATGQSGMVLLRFVIAGGIATTLAYVSRRYFEDPILKLRPPLPRSPSANS